MIGHVTKDCMRVEVEDDTQTVTAYFYDREEPIISRLLNELFRGQFQGPQYGQPGAALLEALAEYLGGTAEYTGPEPKADPGVVY